MKKVTRAISMLLVCVMALCLFTACGDGSYPNADVELLYNKFGCSYSIKQNKDLQAVADIIKTALALKADADEDDAAEAAAEIEELGNSISSNATVKYIALGNGTTSAEADDAIECMGDTLTPAAAADCDYYGIARVQVVNETVAGKLNVKAGSYVTIVLLG